MFGFCLDNRARAGYGAGAMMIQRETSIPILDPRARGHTYAGLSLHTGRGPVSFMVS